MSTAAYLLFLLVVVVGVLEAALRLFDPIGIVYLYDVNRYFKGMIVPDQRFAYIQRANSVGELNGEVFRFNALGLRGPDLAARPPDGVERLLVLGDSVVLGWGVAEQAMFSNRLQALFRTAGLPVEVVAAAAASWNTRTEYSFLKHLGLGLHPDALMLVVVPNDIEPKRDGSDTDVDQRLLFPPDAKPRSWLDNQAEDLWRTAARHSYVAAYLKYLWQETFNRADGPKFDADSPWWRDARLALDRIIDLCAEQGIDLIVYLDGSAEMLDSDPVLRLYHQHLAARGVVGHPMPAALFDSHELRISMVDSHLNAAGNRLLAESMFQAIHSRFESVVAADAPR